MKKTKALFQIMLMISFSLIISIFNAPLVSAQQVCCEKTVSDEYCQYVDVSDCATGLRDPTDPSKGGFRQAPTSCDNTNFCKPGCCFDKEGDGYCYANYPRSNCEIQYNGKFSDEASCEATPECDTGCCVLGTQAFLSTEVRCKGETSAYPDLEMDFRRGIDSETECSNIARSAETGCCVVGEGACTYGSRQECTVTEGEGKGFMKDQFCSEIGSCSCAPGDPALGGAGYPESTTCVAGEDSVYWKDSCGNPEGIVPGPKGECDYSRGTLCGDSDGDGRFECENLDCQKKGEEKEGLSPNFDEDFFGTEDITEGGILNGESWCQYDTDTQNVNRADPTKAPVGSRYFRSLCINGKELVEPCKDYRQEFCVSGTIQNEVSKEDYTEARCIENEWQSCTDQCNTANPFEMSEQEYEQALEKDRTCCTQIDKRDCSWVGRCVPAVGPGFKHWEEEGTNVCGKANMECPVVLSCNGFNSLLGQCEPGSPGATLIGLGAALVGAGAAALLASTGAGVAAAAITFADLTLKQFALQTPGWIVMQGHACLSESYVQGANNLCRSYGDCGANFNYEGELSKAGFTNTKELPEEYNKATINNPRDENIVLNSIISQIGTELDPTKTPGELGEPDWDKGEEFFKFTYPEETSFGDRFAARTGTAGWSAWGPFTAFSLGGSALGAFSLGSFQAAGLVGTAGPIGKLVSFAPGVGEATKTYTAKVAAKASEQAAEQLGKDLPNQFASGSLDSATQKTFQTQLENKLTSNLPPGTPKEGIKEIANKIASEGTEKTLGTVDPTFRSAVEKSINSAQETTLQTAQKTAEAKLSGTAMWADALSTAAWIDMAYEIINVIAEQTKVEKVKVNCGPWAAPTVSKDDQCEQCNPEFWKDDQGKALSAKALKTCSEYRCKSLGASCALINQGTGEEQCVSLSKFDVNSPQISVYLEGFEEEYRDKLDTSSPSGITITEPIPIYTKIRVAIQTDEPAQCKMSFESGKRYQEMEPFYFGGTSHKYFHSQPIFYPASVNVTEGDLTLTKGSQEYTVFVRCEDAVGNANERDYFIKFNIGSEPDATAPVIIGTSIGEEIYIAAGTETTDVDVIVNEPAECRWSFSPLPYGAMPVQNQCKTTNPDRFANYNCRFVGTGPGDNGRAIEDLPSQAGETKFVYFKCQDLSPNGNFNQEPYKLTLKGSNPLEITSIGPEGEIKTSAALENITLTVSTANGARVDGTATCRYTNRESLKNNYPGMDDFFLKTNSSLHEQPLVLPTGSHQFFAGCVDEAGNVAYDNTTFSVLADERAPTILKAYRTEEPSQLVIIVDELATCEENIQTPDFTFGEGNRLIRDGTFHFSLSTPSTPGFVAYHIKCQDEFGNTSPTTTISIIE